MSNQRTAIFQDKETFDTLSRAWGTSPGGVFICYDPDGGWNELVIDPETGEPTGETVWINAPNQITPVVEPNDGRVAIIYPWSDLDWAALQYYCSEEPVVFLEDGLPEDWVYSSES